MEELQLLSEISPLGIIGLLSYIVFHLIKSKEEMSNLKENHLHHLDDKLNEIKMIGDKQLFILEEINKKL